MASYSMPENKQWKIYNIGKNLISSAVGQSKKTGETFKNAANSAGEGLKNGAKSAGSKWKESSTVTKVCVIGSTAAIAASLAIIPVLGVVGFRTDGVIAGSTAASMQTATTKSGSMFARCQSAGAVGAVSKTTSVGVALAAGTAAGGVTAAVCRKKRCSSNNDEQGQNEANEEDDTEDDSDQPPDSSVERAE